MVTLCFPTVRSVPAGNVPAGTFLCGTTTEGGAERDVAFERLARDELCDEYGDAISTLSLNEVEVTKVSRLDGCGGGRLWQGWRGFDSNGQIFDDL